MIDTALREVVRDDIKQGGTSSKEKLIMHMQLSAASNVTASIFHFRCTGNFTFP
jgi:hypothetical protein